MRPGPSYHTDPIGSVRAITDETGAVVIRHDYRPFGEDVQPLTGDPMRFAGKELDEETGQQYFDARYYRNTWGRFTTVDPLVVGAAMTDPQQWNRYAYARNNPLKWVDPSGLCVDTTIGGTTYCVDESVVVHGESTGNSGFNGLFWSGTAWCEAGFSQGAFYGYFNCVDRDSGGGSGGGGGGVDDGGGGGGGGRVVPVADTAPSSGVVDTIQTGLDAVSIGLDATGVGAAVSPVVDVVNGGISLVRGDWWGAATSVWAAVPYVGVSGNLARLGRRLASEEGVAELLSTGGRVIAGPGTSVGLRDVGRLVDQYGGSPGDWVKVTSTAPGHMRRPPQCLDSPEPYLELVPTRADWGRQLPTC